MEKWWQAARWDSNCVVAHEMHSLKHQEKSSGKFGIVRQLTSMHSELFGGMLGRPFEKKIQVKSGTYHYSWRHAHICYIDAEYKGFLFCILKNMNVRWHSWNLVTDLFRFGDVRQMFVFVKSAIVMYKFE